MDACYAVADTSEIFTPALLVFRELMEQNIDRMIRIAGRAERLRPHCKTHKIRQVAEIEMARNITRHKCATLAEAEMLAQAGVRDILWAYNPVGPNVQRTVRFVEAYPEVQLAVTADHPLPVEQLGAAFRAASRRIDVLLDIDTGLQRTGLPPGPQAVELYRQIARTGGLRPGGLHVYDGQNHQQAYAARAAAVARLWSDVLSLRDRLCSEGFPVPRIVAGGSGTFPVYAGIDEPVLELSPGTTVFYDAGYSEAFPDLDFEIAAALLTRVISRPAPDRVTFDLGYKACASDPPADRRVVFPDIPDARIVLQNEEHLVVQTRLANRLQPGDEQMAFPWHICPTTALHKQVYVIQAGRVVDRWDVLARDRWLTI
jgi:D-threonine aldolase